MYASVQGASSGVCACAIESDSHRAFRSSVECEASVCISSAGRGAVGIGIVLLKREMTQIATNYIANHELRTTGRSGSAS